MKKIIVALLLLPVLALAVDGSRDSNGSFTWGTGAGNVVATQTPISSAWANQSFKDVKAMLTDSLSRSGQGGMLATLKLNDAASTGLDINWTGATTTGIYHTPGTVGLQIASNDTMVWTAPGTSVAQGNFSVAAGNMVVSAGNLIVTGGDAIITSGGVNLSSNSYQTVTKTTGGDLYISHAVAGGNVIISTPIGATGTSQVARLSVLGTNTISATIPLTMGNQLISNVLDPVSAQDATTKIYVDTPTAAQTNALITWTSLASANGDCTVSNSPAYTKVRGVVYMRGAMTSSGGAQCCTLTTLAAGHRPSTSKGWNTKATLVLASGGTWTCTPAVGTTYFDGISYPAEQ